MLGDVMGVYYLALVVLHLAVIGGLLYTSLKWVAPLSTNTHTVHPGWRWGWVMGLHE